MDRLPTEIVRYIFELATTDDPETACQLCLVSQAWRLIAQALLFKHVCLFSTKQVNSFNAALSSSPSLNSLIHGLTLSDEVLAFAEPDTVDDYMKYEAGGPQDWIKPWAALLRSLGMLSRQHCLKTLVISAEACRRLAYSGKDYKGKQVKPLRDVLKQSKLRLDHLVISHASVDFFLTRVTTKKITWYGCNFPVVTGALGLSKNAPLVSKQLDEMNFMISDNFNQMHPIDGESGHDGEDEDELDDLFDGNREHRKWPSDLASSIKGLCLTQGKHPKVNVFLHKKTQEAKGQLSQKLTEIKFHVGIGEWGRTADSSHATAEMESFASGGWLHRKSPSASAAVWEDVNEDELDEEDDKTDEDKDKDKSTDSGEDDSQVEVKGNYKWIARRPPGNQFCGCIDMGEGSDVLSDEEDEYWQGDMGAWSDNSDNWDPMQRLAFLSGESYHYSQAYLDEYGM